MALRNLDPFADIASNLTPEKNPYLVHFRQGPEDNPLPIRYGPHLKGMAGSWRELFPDPDAPLYLEIGCHLGKTLCDMATDRPECNFIGVDITFKRVATAAKRAIEKNLTNIQTALLNAVFLDQIFARGELDGVFVFFPDPWTKSRKAKHRLVKPEFLQQVKSCLKSDGFFWLKTDQKIYFEESEEFLRETGFSPIQESQGILKDVYETTFERKFRLQGLPSYGSQWQLAHPKS